MAPILGYWDIRGIAEPIRYLLHYKGIQFEDKRYLSYESWADDKFSLGLDFPNLPYYIDGDLRISQSTAILRHVARKHGFVGTTENERAIEEMAEQQIVDLRTALIRTVYYDADFEKAKAELMKNVPTMLKNLSNFLGKKKFLTGDKISYVDFMAYDTFDFFELLDSSLYKDLPSIKAYMKHFESLPELQKYFKSGVYKRWPIFGPMAKFGGNGEEPKK